MKIEALVVERAGADFEPVELDLAEPGPGEALVKVVSAGLCHTDLAARDGHFPMPLPGVLGHEGAGTVLAVGEGVDTVAVGDHVVIGWPSCGTCRRCESGEPRYCDRLGEGLASGGRMHGPRRGQSAFTRSEGDPVHSHFFGQSSFASHALTWARSLVVVPREAPLELLGPLACGISTGAGAIFNTVRPGLGSQVVIFGAGAVGMAAVMAARLTTATTIIAVDRHESRLELATTLGATHTILADGRDVVARVHEICGGPADASLECTGVLSVVGEAIDVIGPLGVCVLIGGAPPGSQVPMDHTAMLSGKRIVGILGGSGQSTPLIRALVDLHLQGRFPIDRLVQFYGPDEIGQAIDDSTRGAVIKPILHMQG